MPGQPVISGASFAAGLMAQALGTYRRRYAILRERVSMMAELDIPSTRREEIYFYWEAAPHIVRWPRGQNMSAKPFRGVRYTALNHRWARAIEWNNEDLQDDQTNSLLAHARGLGQSAATLDERIVFQIMQGTTDADLLPTIPNAPDGSALYITTTRFGVTNGNDIIAAQSNGIGSSAAVRADYWQTISRFRQFQDTEGQPLFDPGTIDGAKLVIYPAAISGTPGSSVDEVFAEAFIQFRTLDGGAAVSNVVKEANQLPTLWGTQRLTDVNDWYVFLGASDIKPLFSQLREGLREVIATFENSDVARSSGVESVRWFMRKGYGVNLPFATIKVSE